MTPVEKAAAARNTLRALARCVERYVVAEGLSGFEQDVAEGEVRGLYEAADAADREVDRLMAEWFAAKP